MSEPTTEEIIAWLLKEAKYAARSSEVGARRLRIAAERLRETLPEKQDHTIEATASEKGSFLP